MVRSLSRNGTDIRPTGSVVMFAHSQLERNRIKWACVVFLQLEEEAEEEETEAGQHSGVI